MADIFAIQTSRQRRVLVGALVVYAALFVADLTTGNRFAGAGQDLLFGALVLTASIVAARRVQAMGSPGPIAVVTVGVFAVAGLAIGYQGLVALSVVPPVALISRVATLALLATLGLYFYDQYA